MKPSPYARIKSEVKSEINVVPYVDVMLVLLVIFMVTAPAITSGVDIDLPKAVTKNIDTRMKLPVIVSLTIGNEIFISTDNGKEEFVTEEELTQRLLLMQENSGEDIQVMLKADRNIAYGDVMTLMSNLQRSGIVKVGLITDPDISS